MEYRGWSTEFSFRVRSTVFSSVSTGCGFTSSVVFWMTSCISNRMKTRSGRNFVRWIVAVVLGCHVVGGLPFSDGLDTVPGFVLLGFRVSVLGGGDLNVRGNYRGKTTFRKAFPPSFCFQKRFSV